MEGVHESGGFRVGDVVRHKSGICYRVEIIYPPAPPESAPWAEFTPVKKDGTRDLRRSAFGGPLVNYAIVRREPVPACVVVTDDDGEID